MTIAITSAHVVPIAAAPFTGTVLMDSSGILALGSDIEIPAGAEIIDAAGAWVLPGFIDAHVHLGVSEEGEGWAGEDTNEMTDPNMAAARAIDAINPADIGFDDALSGGVTCVNVNPGSGNPIGGLTVALKTHGRYVEEMLVRSPSGLKSALGENPKRVYGEQSKTPSTRLGVALTLRQAFTAARAHQVALDAAAGDEDATPVPGNLTHESLIRVLNREIPWRQHCHRADDIGTAIRIADEFGYDLVLDHGTESSLLADVLAQRSIPVLHGPMIVSRSKVEVRRRSAKAPAILDRAGVNVSIITDHPVVPIEFLVTQAALAVKEGMDTDAALRAITLNPAIVMGVDERVGSLEPGKDADVVLWTGDPLDFASRPSRVWIDGQQVYAFDASTGEATIPTRS